MATYQKIEYRISPDGKVTETVLNGDGKSCLLATKSLEESLGKVEARELLPEYKDDDQNFLTLDQTQALKQQ
ncbi:MAG: DUF2997 domain-containing protein [Merismopedia sp. SIO2A8]|nr:DUF2997 domain-containing protein [Merismopedia sp. SIO2A8]